MATPIVLNPAGPFTIAQGTSSFGGEGVTGAVITYGGTSGGPYPNTYVVPSSVVSTDEASGTITMALPTGLAYGTYFAVAYVVNAAGTSGASDEVGWAVEPTTVPAAPVFSIA